MGYVYYTKTRTTVNENSNKLGNIMYRCGVNNGEPEKIGDDGTAEKGTTFTPLAVTPYGTGSAQFVFSTYLEKELCAFTKANDPYVEPETNGNSSGLTSSNTVSVYANAFCLIDSALYHYEVNGTRVILDNNKLMSSVDKVLAIMGDVAYVQSGSTISIIKLNGSTTTVSTSMTTTDDTTDESSDSGSSDTNTLPIAVLYQPAGNTGNPMMLVHDDNSIRLYYTDQTYRYIRIKNA